MRTLLIVGAALLVVPSGARAGGFAVAEQSPTAAGTGSAGTGRTDDAGAAWYNPAALADGGGWRVGLGLLAALPSLSAEAMDGSWQTDNESSWVTPPHLHLSVAVGELAVGVAAGVPFGSGVTWPADWPGRFEIVRTRLEVFRASPFVAYRLGRLRVSGGVHVDAARLRIGRQLDFIDAEGEVAIDMDGTGVGVDAAALYGATDALNLGVSYKSRTRLSLQGGADFESPDAFSMKTADQAARADITTPDRIAVGAAWRRGRVTALADVELTLWGTYDQLVVDFANDETPDARQVNGWESTLALRGGAEWAPDDAWVARAGGFFDPSPATDANLAPSSPDASRLGATLGAGYRVGPWSFDAFYEYLHLLGREAANDNALDARYGGHAQLFGLGVRYQSRERSPWR